jgi:hypothetical protein
MTTPLVLADPLDYGNKPGDGPLRPGGQAPPEGMIQKGANLPSTRSAASKAQGAALELVRDLAAGAERVRGRATVYLPRAPGEEPANYTDRLNRSVYHNFFGRTTEGLTGLVFRKDPEMGDDVPPKIRDHWENIDNAGTHGDVFVRDLFEDALTAGHAAILVEYPNTGGQVLSLKAESPLRPYWVHVYKDNIVSWRTDIEAGAQVLTQLVLLERTMVPNGEYGEREQVRYRVFRRENGVVAFQLLEVTKNNTVMVVDEGPITNQTEIPIAEVATSGRYGLFESIPPLLDLAYLNVAHYQQWSDYATSIHMTCVPILFMAGVMPTEQDGKQVVVGPNAAVRSQDTNAKVSYVSHDGGALDACKAALDDLKADMGTLGLAMLAPQKRTAETAEAKRLDKSTADSALAVAARGLQDAVERALQFHANYMRMDSGGSVEINRDFEGLLMEAPVMQAYAALVNAGFPEMAVLEMLQRGGRIPEDTDLEELHLEMLAGQQAAQIDQMTAEETEPEETAAVGNPYKVVKRAGNWVVIKADTNAVVPGGNHGKDKSKALAHFKALEANVKE